MTKRMLWTLGSEIVASLAIAGCQTLTCQAPDAVTLVTDGHCLPRLAEAQLAPMP